MSLRLAACLLALAAGCSQLPPEAAFLALLDARYARGDTIPEAPEALLARLPAVCSGCSREVVHAQRFTTAEASFSWVEVRDWLPDCTPRSVSLSDYAADSAALRDFVRRASSRGLQPEPGASASELRWRWDDPASQTSGTEVLLAGRYHLSCTTRSGYSQASRNLFPAP